MKVPPDHAARQEALAVSRSFVVQAPAGSGKTELLVQRMLALLSTVEAPEAMMAVTFTRKAAAEMKHRILQALREPDQVQQATTQHWALKASQHAQRLGWHLSEHPNRLRIMTIDALAKELASQRPSSARLGGAIEVLEDPERAYAVATERWLAEGCACPEQRAWQAQLLRLCDNQWPRVIATGVHVLGVRDQWMPVMGRVAQKGYVPWMEASINLLIDQAWSSLAPHVWHDAEVWEALTHAWSQQGLDPEAWSTPAQRLFLCAHTLLTQDNGVRKSLSKHQGVLAPSQTTDPDLKAQRQAHKERLGSLLAQLREERGAAEALRLGKVLDPEAPVLPEDDALLQGWLRYLPHLIAHAHAVFDQWGQVDFTEITLMAIEALSGIDEEPRLAITLDATLQHLLIDECQDTSGLQFQLFARMTQTWRPGDGRTVFLVGDPMQSIYRFRGAQVALFLRAQAQGWPHVPMTPLALTANFRSAAPLVNTFNPWFSFWMSDRGEPLRGRVPFVPAQAQIPETQDGDPAWQGVSVVGWLHTPQAARKEALWIVAEAQKAIAQGLRVAVLARTRRQLAPTLQVLNEHKVPFDGHALQTIVQQPWVMDLMALCQAVQNPSDRLSWMAVLRAPFWGLGPEALWRVAQSSLGTHDVLAVLNDPEVIAGEPQEVQSRVRQGVRWVLHWRAHWGRVGLADGLRALWDHLGAPHAYSGYQAQDVSLVLDRIHQLVLEEGFVRAKRLREVCERVFCVCHNQENNVPLHVMTIHKAKGLEFDVVFLPALHAPAAADTLPWFSCWSFEHDNAPYALLCGDHHNATHQLARIQHQLLSEQRHNEALRLLYVAVTRAKKKVCLLGRVNAQGAPVGRQSHWAWVTAQHPPVVLQDDDEEEGGAPASRVVWRSERLAHALAPEAPESVLIDQDNAAWQAEGISVVHVSRWQQQRLGVVYHRILQSMSEATLPRWVADWPQKKRLIPAWLQHMGVPPEESVCRACEAWVQGVVLCPVAQRLFHPANSHAQQERVLCLPNPPHVVRLDLMFCDPQGHPWVVDFKSFALDPQSRAQARQQVLHYGHQVQAQRLLGASHPVRVGIYAPNTPEVWEAKVLHEADGLWSKRLLPVGGASEPVRVGLMCDEQRW